VAAEVEKVLLARELLEKRSPDAASAAGGATRKGGAPEGG